MARAMSSFPVPLSPVMRTLARVGALAAAIEAQPGTRLPGARRRTLRAKAEAEGLTVADALLKEIRA